MQAQPLLEGMQQRREHKVSSAGAIQTAYRARRRHIFNVQLWQQALSTQSKATKQRKALEFECRTAAALSIQASVRRRMAAAAAQQHLNIIQRLQAVFRGKAVRAGGVV